MLRVLLIGLVLRHERPEPSCVTAVIESDRNKGAAEVSDPPI